MSGIPELLYHTVLTVVDYHLEKSGSARSVYVLGTHTTLAAAKAFAATSLKGLGYEPSDFAEYAVRGTEKESTPWKHGDGIIVFARAPAGQEFSVGLDTTPNDQEFPAGPNGTLMLTAFPEARDNAAHHLHYVLQTRIDYDEDRSGGRRTTNIEGCFQHRSEALEAARKSLRSTNTNFAEYDERDSAAMTGEWPYGEDIVVHAVAQTGENFLVAVRTIPGAHAKHGKKQN